MSQFDKVSSLFIINEAATDVTDFCEYHQKNDWQQ